MGCSQSAPAPAVPEKTFADIFPPDGNPPLPEGADPNTFPAFAARSPDAYTTFNSINWLLKRGDLGLVVGEFLYGKRKTGFMTKSWSGGLDAPIPIRQHLPDGATFGGPLELDEKGKENAAANEQQVFALSYTWNTPWPPDATIGGHPDPNQYYLTRVKKALRLYKEDMSPTVGGYDKPVFVFWVRRSLSRAARVAPTHGARRTGLDVALSDI